MTLLKIGPGFILPQEFVTSMEAISCPQESGKSYTPSVKAEELLAAYIQVAVIDPTGAWFGIESSADGKSLGFPIVVFGGEPADVSLESTAGEMLVEQKFSAVFDLSPVGEAIRFVTAFTNELFKFKRAAMHLFIVVAQSPMSCW